MKDIREFVAEDLGLTIRMDEGDRAEDDNEAQRGPVEEDERPREEMPSDEEINAMYEAAERPQTEKEAYEHAH